MRNHTKNSPQTKHGASSVARQALNLVTILILAVAPILSNPNSTESVSAETSTGLPDISQLSLKSVQRLLIISPHPDDETIAPGGLIQAALANGSEVRVVIVTNGDGQFMAPVIFGMEDALTPAGYIAMGERRQAESLKALEQLGIPAENILFLGYPDRGIEPMLHENWDKAHPYTAPFIRTENSPYSNTFTPGAAHCGAGLFSDLETILSSYRPDLIVLPHPADQHSDHQAASAFTSLAVAAVKSGDFTYHPQLWAYLVHYGKYPESPVNDPSDGFVPPSDLAGANNSWGSLTLTPAQVSNKNTAIQAYPTQTLLLGNFLPDFARANEIFMLLSAQDPAVVMPEPTNKEIPPFTSAELLPMNANPLPSLQINHVIHLIQFNGKERICQQTESGYAGAETILWDRPRTDVRIGTVPASSN